MEISILLQNRKTRKEAWLYLPLCYDEDFEEEFDKWLIDELGCTGYYPSEYAIIDSDSEIDIFPEFKDSGSVKELNYWANRIEDEIKAKDEDLFKAIYKNETYNLDCAISLTNSGDYFLLPKIDDLEDFGFWAIENDCFGKVQEDLKKYIDYAQVGADYQEEGKICFTDYGCLVCF